MDLSYSDEQEFLRESVRGTVDRSASLATVREWVLEGEVDHDSAFALAAQQGWTGIGLAEDAGGQGGDAIELSILAEELGRSAVPADALYASLLTARLLSDAGGAAETVAAIAAGEQRGALALSAAGPLDAPASDVSPVPLALGAAGADVVVGRDADGLFVAADAQATPRTMVDRTRALADVSVTRGDALDGDALARLAPLAAVIVAADALGACQRMLDLTVEYVGDRVQFGVAVGSFQAVKHAASEMLVAIEGTRALVQYAAWAVADGDDNAAQDAWVAKARSAQAAKLVADKALFLHGAVGYTWEHDLQLLFKRAKSDAQLLGGAGVYEDRIADGLLA